MVDVYPKIIWATGKSAMHTHTQKKFEILNKIEREANQQKTIRQRKRKIALLMFCL